MAHRAASEDSADVVLYADPAELLDDSALRVNARRRRRSLEHPALDLYGGYDNFLVRTALIRSEGYDPNERVVIDSAANVAELCKHLIYADQEHMVTVAVDGAMQLRAIHEVAIGHSSGVGITPQHLIKVAMLTTATAILVVHNHPSGWPRPSQDDLRMAEAASATLECTGITFMDSVIVGDRGWLSIAQDLGKPFKYANSVKADAVRWTVYPWK